MKIADTKVISVEDLLIGQLTLVREPFLVEQTSHFKFNDFSDQYVEYSYL